MESALSLAELAGNEVSRAFIHQVEQGRSRPSRQVLELIARRTRKPITFFTAPSGAPDMQLDLSGAMLDIAGRVRRFAASATLTESENEALRLVELSVRQGAKMLRAIEAEGGQSKATELTGS